MLFHKEYNKTLKKYVNFSERFLVDCLGPRGSCVSSFIGIRPVIRDQSVSLTFMLRDISFCINTFLTRDGEQVFFSIFISGGYGHRHMLMK